jgi:tetratricopeptide (TPR) repeat protein
MTMPTHPRRCLYLALLVFCLCAAVPAGAEEKWIEVRTAHFTVQTPGSEKDGRKIADQFEQIRALFHSAFPTLRTDPAQPIVVIAVKSESGMKLYLPEMWDTRGHSHAVGLYQAGFDKHYVILQMDAEGNNPYHALYHEYTHALIHLNFSNIPLWLDEGVAEYLGNASIGDKESRVGLIDPGNVYVFQQNKPLPIETLFAVDHASPYYNEANRTSIFYAESWALVHYLMLSPEARQKQLLNHFMTAWSTTRDPLQAAQQTFGDLKKFQGVLDAYIRVGNFYNGVVKNSTEGVDVQYTTRAVSPAEVLAVRGDFFSHHTRLEAAKPLLDEAVKQAPEQPFPHAVLAFYYYRAHEMPDVQREAREAIRLGDKGFITPYLEALSIQSAGMRASSDTHGADSLHQVIDLFSASLKLNPNFAPTCFALANAYAIFPDKQNAAIGAAIQAVKMDPLDLQYSVQLVHLLLNNNRYQDAKYISAKISASAFTPHERDTAGKLAEFVAGRKGDGNTNASISATAPGTVVYRKSPEAGSSSGTGTGEAAAQLTGAPTTHQTITPPSSKALVVVEGELADVDCSKVPEITLDMVKDGEETVYHIADAKVLDVSMQDKSPALACKQWFGKKVKLWTAPPADPADVAEITRIFFE